MDAENPPPALKLYPAGRRVRFTDRARLKFPILKKVGHGLLLKSLEMPGHGIMLIVEYLVAITASPEFRNFEAQDVEVLPIDLEAVRHDLIGRAVHFPRSSGIGIRFPEGASDYGRIIGVDVSAGAVSVTLEIPVAGAISGAPFVTFADFSQCDLVPAHEKKDPGS